jgi:hypothetical protein
LDVAITEINAETGDNEGTGQIRERVKEDKNGIGIAEARNFSSEAGEIAQGRMLNHQSLRRENALGLAGLRRADGSD